MAAVGGPVLKAPAPRPRRSVQLALKGIAGWSYRIGGSTNLAGWMPLTSLVATKAAMPIIDRGAKSLSHRFCRAPAP